MRFKKYITELSAKLKSFTARIESGRKFSTVFKTDNHEFEFWAEWRDGDIWLVAFFRSQEEMWASGNITQRREYGPMGDVSPKEAIQVFAGVQKSLETFIKKYKPKVFEFDADDRDHMKLYDSISSIIAKKSGYILKTRQHRVKTYVFTRPDLKNESYEKGFNSVSSGYIEVFVNPSKKEMDEASNQGFYGGRGGAKSVRFIAQGRTRKLYVWTADVLHDEAWAGLGFAGNYYSGNTLAGIAEKRGGKWIMTDSTSLVDKDVFDWSWVEKYIQVENFIRYWTKRRAA